jgi:uncharacterized protein with von Willebrand factor type A (vWA) domain
VTAAIATRRDLATVIARFGHELRNAGMSVSPGESAGLARVIEVTQPVTVGELYWCARVSLLRSIDLLPTFDKVFAMVFRGLIDLAESRGEVGPPVPVSSPAVRSPSPDEGAVTGGTMTATEGSHAGESDGPTVLNRAMASSSERLTEIDFAKLTSDELRALTPLLQSLLATLPRRQTRRRHRHPHGDRMDVRATLRGSIRSAGDPVRTIRRNRDSKPRQLVALLDISGSMEPYARAYLHLLWGAAAHAHAEVFVFGTRLTRLTRALRIGQPDMAMDRAAKIMPDWSGGTRIGHAIKEFLDGYGRRGMAHGAVVLIVSDGWERDDPAVLGSQIEALSRRTYRLVWANPRAAAPGFEPTTGGMSAALPYLDDLVSGHSAAAMAAVVRALGADSG